MPAARADVCNSGTAARIRHNSRGAKDVESPVGGNPVETGEGIYPTSEIGRKTMKMVHRILLAACWMISIALPLLAIIQQAASNIRSEEHTSELQELRHLGCRLL